MGQPDCVRRNRLNIKLVPCGPHVDNTKQWDKVNVWETNRWDIELVPQASHVQRMKNGDILPLCEPAREKSNRLTGQEKLAFCLSIT